MKKYINPIAQKGLDNAAQELPTGSIVVKENYMPDKKLAAVTVMYKAPGDYNEENANWFWLKRLANGEVEAAGKVESCQVCHDKSEIDYLLSPLPSQ